MFASLETMSVLLCVCSLVSWGIAVGLTGVLCPGRSLNGNQITDAGVAKLADELPRTELTTLA